MSTNQPKSYADPKRQQQQQQPPPPQAPPVAQQYSAPEPESDAVSVPAPLSPLARTLGSVQWRYQQNSASGRPTGAGVNTGAGITRPKTEAELEADRLYEEAMEDEYAKRDGGC